VVFVDGCFWHGCPLHYVAPRTRRSFWASKLIHNIERDRRQTLQLEEEGWTVIRVWEHEVQAELERVGNEIEDAVRIGGASKQPRWCVWKVEGIPSHKGHERRYLVDLRHPARLAVDEGPRFSRRGPKDPSKIARRWQGTDLEALRDAIGKTFA
jgi:DNA mismatch endonuclease (patch repair protein)